MTRQEEINNASNELFSSFRCSKSYKMGFEAGVMWADEHPKSSKCDSCIRRISGECDEFGLETLCGFAYAPIM